MRAMKYLNDLYLFYKEMQHLRSLYLYMRGLVLNCFNSIIDSIAKMLNYFYLKVYCLLLQIGISITQPNEFYSPNLFISKLYYITQGNLFKIRLTMEYNYLCFSIM